MRNLLLAVMTGFIGREILAIWQQNHAARRECADIDTSEAVSPQLEDRIMNTDSPSTAWNDIKPRKAV